MPENKKSYLLIVDDSMMNREIFGEIFNEDFEILEAENGLEGLQIIEEKKDMLDAVLLDVVMPVMDGFQVLAQMHLKGITKKIPVFLITADDTKEAAAKGFEYGVIDVIRRPFAMDAVHKKVLSIVRMFQKQKEHNAE